MVLKRPLLAAKWTQNGCEMVNYRARNVDMRQAACRCQAIAVLELRGSLSLDRPP